MKSKIHKRFVKVLIVALCFFCSGLLLFQGDGRANEVDVVVFEFKIPVELKNLMKEVEKMYVRVTIYNKETNQAIAAKTSEHYDINDDGSLSEEITIKFYEKNFFGYPPGTATHYKAKIGIHNSVLFIWDVPQLPPNDLLEPNIEWKMAQPSGFVPEVTGPMNQKKFSQLTKKII